MYKAKIRMMRAIAVLLIGISSLFLSGCASRLLHGSAHPHSDVITPTFCLHEGDADGKDAPPVPIYRISVFQTNEKRDNQRLEWRNWRLWRGRGGRRAFIDEVPWETEYGDPTVASTLCPRPRYGVAHH